MVSNWATSLFKGRIGEAVIEAVLSEFSYQVTRSGYEQLSSGSVRATPDLVVTHPGTRERRYVEVKYRSARPTSVQLDGKRLAEYRASYPRTVLAVSSAWDGAIYCAEVEDLPTTPGNFSVSLLDEVWRPIWHFFPLIKRGERLKRTWQELQRTLSMYGTRQSFGRRDQKLWEAEYDVLTLFLKESWTEDLAQHGITEPQVDKMTLEELWETARHINAVSLAEQLLDPADDNPIDGLLMLPTVNRALGRRGENHLVIDLTKLATALGREHGDPNVRSLATRITGMMKSFMDGGSTIQSDQLLAAIPDGIGEVYLTDQAMSPQDMERVDLKTAIRLVINPCRIDV